MLTKCFYNPEAQKCFRDIFPAQPTPNPIELPVLHAVIFPKELDKTALSGLTVFQCWEEFSTHQNAKQMLGSGVAHQPVQKQSLHVTIKKKPHFEIIKQLPLAAINYLEGMCVMENFHSVLKIC